MQYFQPYKKGGDVQFVGTGTLAEMRCMCSHPRERCDALSVPHHRDAITIQDPVFRCQRESFGERLGYQDAIEWVLVKIGQTR